LKDNIEKKCGQACITPAFKHAIHFLFWDSFTLKRLRKQFQSQNVTTAQPVLAVFLYNLPVYTVKKSMLQFGTKTCI
jgi:hypothetical protein